MTVQHAPEQLVKQFIRLFGGQGDYEYFAGGHDWSDGILFRYRRDNSNYLLKLSQSNDEQQVKALSERQAFVRYLAENGIRTTSPISSQQGKLVESSIWEGEIYLAFAWKMLDGEGYKDQHPNELQGFYAQWGSMIGRLHQLAKKYPTWKESETLASTGNSILSWQAEWDIFYNWIPDAEVKQAWQGMHSFLQDYPRSRENFGFIHNDAHPQNMLFDKEGIILLDFEVANYHWFVTDIAICLYSEISRISFHSTHQCARADMQELFIKPFIEAYNSVNSLPRADLAHLEQFLNYRRFLMFTVFYNQIKKHNPRYLEEFKQQIIQGKNFLPEESLEYILKTRKT